MSAPVATTVEEQLAWEARWRTRASLSALAAGALTLAGGIVSAVVYSDYPHVLLVDGLRAALQGGTQVSLRTQQVLFYDDHAFSLILSSGLHAVGALAIAWPLAYLYRATRFRREQVPSAALFLAVAGPVALMVSELVQQVAVTLDAHDFAGATDHSRDAVDNVLQSTPVVAAAIIRQFGVLVLGFAMVMITLNAMRAGLLTRFMGVLGIIVAILFVIPIGSPLPIVQSFWFGALAVLLAGRWPNGMPPAWASGQEEAWPTQQQLREARSEAAGRDEPEPAEDYDEDENAEAQAATGTPHPSSKKRKRKRRT